MVVFLGGNCLLGIAVGPGGTFAIIGAAGAVRALIGDVGGNGIAGVTGKDIGAGATGLLNARLFLTGGCAAGSGVAGMFAMAAGAVGAAGVGVPAGIPPRRGVRMLSGAAFGFPFRSSPFGADAVEELGLT